MASNSLQFTTQASRNYRLTAPAPEPIGKRGALNSPHDASSSLAAEIFLTRKSKERSGLTEYDYDIQGVRRPRSRPASIRSSRKSSARSRTMQRKRSAETVKSSRVSIASSRLSGRFSRLIIEEPASLINIPTELVHSIVRYLPRSDLLNFMLVCQQLRAETIMLLYSKPYFQTTFRFAQFVTTISHNSRLADLVRELDLSHFSKLPKDLELAGWREWKYRTESLYSIYPGNDSDNPDRKHPLAHPLLLKYSTGGHDVPLGALMHIVKACPHLRYYLFKSN
jgi:F-box-like